MTGLFNITPPSRSARHWAFRSMFAALAVVSVQYAAYAGPFEKPKITKESRIIKLPDLGIMDLAPGDTPNSVYVMVGNVGQANSGWFVVRLSIQKKGQRTKTYVDKMVSGLKAGSDVPLNIDAGQPLEGLEVGVFIDAKKQVVETNEKNCGKVFPDGGVAGSLSCDAF